VIEEEFFMFLLRPNVYFGSCEETFSPELIRLNVKNVISFEKSFTHSLLNKPSFLIDIPDFKTPSQLQVKTFISTMSLYLREGAVFMHCLAGNGRTGLMASILLVEMDGLAPDKALSCVRNLNPHAVETEEQLQFLLQSKWK
jgi:protein-tyrosine phosphatase